jgi:hypothetical protein
MNKDCPRIPIKFRDRVAGFPESSMCATRIKLTLSDGQIIRDVFIGGDGTIAKIGTKLVENLDSLNFNPMDIVEVNSEI